jgi:hypothetical protein
MRTPSKWLSYWIWSSCLPVVASQIRAVPSVLAVASCVPSALNTTPFASPLCGTWSSSLPLIASQIRAILSSLAVANRVPSGLNATPWTWKISPAAVFPKESACLQVPHLDPPAGTDNHLGSVRAYGNRGDFFTSPDLVRIRDDALSVARFGPG